MSLDIHTYFEPATAEHQFWILLLGPNNERKIAEPIGPLKFGEPIESGLMLPKPTFTIPYELERWHNVTQSIMNHLWSEGLRPSERDFTDDQLKGQQAEIGRLELHLDDMRRLFHRHIDREYKTDE